MVTDYRDQDSVEVKSLYKQNNGILAFGGAVNHDGADKAGRSFSSSNLFLDEVAFFNSNQYFYKSALQATNTAILHAKANNTPYGIHMTTTPAKIKMLEPGVPDTMKDGGTWAYDFFNDAAPFRYELTDMDDEQLYEYLNNNSYSGRPGNGFLRLEIDWRAVGRPQS